MPDNQSLRYMVSLTFTIKGNPIPQSYSVFLPMEEKYENINVSMVKQFGALGEDWLKKNGYPEISNLFVSGISYLGYMSNNDFFAE